MAYKLSAFAAIFAAMYLAYIFGLPGFIGKLFPFLFKDMSHAGATMILLLILVCIWSYKRPADYSNSSLRE